jgi:hypothetical protein
MRRLSIVPLIAAAIVVGHVMPHLLATRYRTSEPRIARPSAVRGESPPLVAPTCRLQPPPAVADREPMLDALRQLIAREEKRYPYLADNDLTIVSRFDPCGVAVAGHIAVR